MITVRAKGGLGNQLFQYAAGYSLARRLGQEISIDHSFFPKQTLRGYKLDKLSLDKTCFDEQRSVKIKVLKNKYLNKILRQMNKSVIDLGKNSIYLLECRSDLVQAFPQIEAENVYLDGYYQSEQYFREYKTDLMRQFTPNYPSEAEYQSVLAEIQDCEAVAVHVRRGDFLNAQNDSNPNHYLLGEQYYHNALKYSAAHLKDPVFFWFSDDIDWVKKNFGEKNNFRFVSLHTRYADIDEMMLMKSCRHIIAANSTFSWWASWLNEQEDAMHICPKKRYGNLYMIPDEWIKISVE